MYRDYQLSNYQYINEQYIDLQQLLLIPNAELELVGIQELNIIYKAGPYYI
jgi:hypothetical protein